MGWRRPRDPCRERSLCRPPQNFCCRSSRRQYYEFVAVLEGRRFKAIVKQLPGGERIFWSLIPFWRQTEQGRRLLHDGNPAED